MRSALTTLGIVIGIAAVITMLAVGEGARRQVAEQMKSLGTNLMLVLPGTVTSGGVRLGGASRDSLTEADVLAMRAEIADVAAAAPALRGSGQVVYGNQNWSTQLYGIDADYLVARDWRIERGRAFDDNDLHGNAKVALVGETVAQMLFGGTDPTGLTIRVKGVPLTIVGLLGGKGQNVMGQDQDDIVLIPLGTARGRLLGQSLGRPDSVNNVTVKMADGVDMRAAEAQVRALLRQRHRIQPGQDDDFNIRNLSEIVQAEQASSNALSALLAAIASVSLIVGGIGIMNIMLVSVTERTREIGIRLAVGARRRDILTQFMVEAVTLSVLGGLVGVALGLGGGLLVQRLFDWPVAFQARAVLLAVVSASAVGIFFGWYPARQAARLTPVEALRHD
ncbi:FtsX-like permease family protein [Parasulfuritortus cantonensis]|uniref:FtsX-like permease family protein n=2 Tax=Parasulfuritortus cantonensis TaxID=2528202 RepID=A0A4R1B8J3_9PROT|nr:FtsX-like permease family protein [Parasulfuritortus cantonensis]